MRKAVALLGIMSFGLASLTWSASITVGKAGAQQTTVQGGLNAAGANGTVTIVDSATYNEDVFVIPGFHDGVTLQAAQGQRPTISAVNGINRWAHLPIPVDRMGFIASTHCTIVGLNIENTDPAMNALGFAGAFCAQAADAPALPRITVRDCKLSGPATPSGNFVAGVCLSWDLAGNYPEAVFENCEFTDTAYSFINVNFGPPGAAQGLWPVGTLFGDPVSTATNCLFHHNANDGVDCMAGVMTLVNCNVTSNSESGVECGGGTLRLIGCNITDNGEQGIQLDFAEGDYNFQRTNYPVVEATNCLIARNQGSGHNANVMVVDGTITLDHCVISEPQNTDAIFLDDNHTDTPCILRMNFCDVYAPGRDCFAWDMDVNEHPIDIEVKNSILVGRNGLVNSFPGIHPMSVTYSDIHVTDVATSGVTESDNVAIQPLYLAPGTATRGNFRYFNDNLNVGEAGADIGSQGRYQPLGIRIHIWSLYY